MTQRFNLLDEPWIRVTRLDGAPDEVSLLALFQEATDIAGIHGEIASQDVAILRLLLAICHRTMDGPEDLDTWREYWEEPERLGRDASTYLERYRERFDLRDPDRPFFQVAGIHAASGKISGLESLIADVPNGNPFFTTRIAQGLESIGWAEAARWLVHVHAFDPSGIRTGAVGDPQVKGGKGYPIGPGWTGQIGTVTVAGESLEQTLLLNTVVCEELSDLVDVDPEQFCGLELAACLGECVGELIDGDEALGGFTCDVGLDVRRLAGAVPALEVDELVDEGASRFGDGLLDGEPDGGSVGAP